MRSDMAFQAFVCYLISRYQFCGSLLLNRLFRVQKRPQIKDFLGSIGIYNRIEFVTGTTASLVSG